MERRRPTSSDKDSYGSCPADGDADGLPVRRRDALRDGRGSSRPSECCRRAFDSARRRCTSDYHARWNGGLLPGASTSFSVVEHKGKLAAVVDEMPLTDLKTR